MTDLTWSTNTMGVATAPTALRRVYYLLRSCTSSAACTKYLEYLLVAIISQKPNSPPTQRCMYIAQADFVIDAQYQLIFQYSARQSGTVTSALISFNVDRTGHVDREQILHAYNQSTYVLVVLLRTTSTTWHEGPLVPTVPHVFHAGTPTVHTPYGVLILSGRQTSLNIRDA